MFIIGRAIHTLRLDDLHDAQREMEALQAVVDILVWRKGMGNTEGP